MMDDMRKGPPPPLPVSHMPHHSHHHHHHSSRAGPRYSLPNTMDTDNGFDDPDSVAADFGRRAQLSSASNTPASATSRALVAAMAGGDQPDFSPAQHMAMDDKLDEVLRGIGKWVSRVADKLSQEDVREWLKVKSDSQSNFMGWANSLGKQ